MRELLDMLVSWASTLPWLDSGLVFSSDASSRSSGFTSYSYPCSGELWFADMSPSGISPSPAAALSSPAAAHSLSPSSSTANADGCSFLDPALLLVSLAVILSSRASTSSFYMELKHSWWAFAMSSFALDVYSIAFSMNSWACLVLSSNAFKILSASDFLLLPTTSIILYPKELLKLG